MLLFYVFSALIAAAEGILNLLFCLVLAQRVHRPNSGGYPANQGDLQDQAQQASKGAANGEKHRKGQKQSQQQAHG